jgi:hypothetical protein
VFLQVAKLEGSQIETSAEGRDQVVEVDRRGVKGLHLPSRLVRLQIGVPQIAEGRLLRNPLRYCRSAWLAVVLHEAGLGRLGLGLGDPTDRQRGAAILPVELAVPRISLLFGQGRDARRDSTRAQLHPHRS